MSIRRDPLKLWNAVRDVLTNSPKRGRLDRKELALVQHFVAVLRQYEEDELDVSEKAVADRMEDADFDPDYDPSVDSEVTYALPTDPNNPSMCRIGDSLVPIDDVRKAVEFYGSFGPASHNGLIRPSFNTVRKLFPFVKKEQHLRKLGEFEKNGVKINLQNAIKWVSKELYATVAHHLEQGHVLHDNDLQAMAVAYSSWYSPPSSHDFLKFY